MQGVSSAFWLRMQGEAIEMATLIDVLTDTGSWHWTLAPNQIIATFSGESITYQPAPVQSDLLMKQRNDLSVDNVSMIFANTDSLLSTLMKVEDIDFAKVNVRRVFADTPDLGFLQVFEGETGEQTHDRVNASIQVRNRWQSLSRIFPHLVYQDTCIWRFGGPGCGFSVATVTLAASYGNLASATDVTLVFTAGWLANSFANGWFDMGRVTFSAGQNKGAVRTIRSHSGDALRLSRPLPYTPTTTDVFSFHPGCRKRLITDCHSKYGNVQSGYCGFRWLPILEDGNQPITAT